MLFKRRFLLMILTMLYLPLAVAQHSPVGRWITVDDKSGKKRAEIELKLGADGTMYGVIDKTYPEPGDVGICSHCPGKFKDKPIQGLRFMWGLVDKGHGHWGDGHILDAKSGTIYRVKITAKKDHLYVRGFIGVSFIGRTQVWVRQR